METETDSPSLDEILALEHAVWQALLGGDAVADAALLSERYLGVYATGFGDRAEHVRQLDDGPTVAEYRIERARHLPLGPGMALLAYLAVYRRTGDGGAPEEYMYVSSLWRREAGEWRNIFSQDTEAGAKRPV